MPLFATIVKTRGDGSGSVRSSLGSKDGVAIARKRPIRDSTQLLTDSPITISLEMVEQYLRKEGVNCCAYINTMHSLSHPQVKR